MFCPTWIMDVDHVFCFLSFVWVVVEIPDSALCDAKTSFIASPKITFWVLKNALNEFIERNIRDFRTSSRSFCPISNNYLAISNSHLSDFFFST